MAVWQLTIAVDASSSDALSAALFDAGAGGLEQRDGALVVWTDDVALLERLRLAAARVVRPDAIAEHVCDDRWRTAWTEHLAQERVSDGFVVQAEWDDTPPPQGVQRIRLAPELAFGVGSHPTTRLAARAVERHCRAHPGGSVLDVGTGTGVLAIVAALSGAGSVTGIDVDPIAIAAARRNARLNGARARLETTPLSAIAGTFELVVANLEAPVLLALAADLARCTAPGGALVVTGFIDEREAEIRRALPRHVADDAGEGDWRLLVLA